MFADDEGKYNRRVNDAGKYVPDTAGWYVHDGLGYYVRDDRGIYVSDGKGYYTLNGEGKYTWNGSGLYFEFFIRIFRNKLDDIPEVNKLPSFFFIIEFVMVPETDPFIPTIDYKYDILTKDKIHIKQIGGYVNKGSNKEILRVKGSYSYVGADKKIYVVEYISAENGFKVTGTHVYEPDSTQAEGFLKK